MTIVVPPTENRFVITADWDIYLKMLDALGDRAVRVTYDNGRLELKSPSYDHEKGKTTLAALLESLLVHYDLDFDAGGSTTFKNEALQQGLEPDECYWVRNVDQLSGAWNSATDPYPDLAIEVEVSRSVIDRLGILAALGVQEVWRLTADGDLECLHLQDGRYEPRSSSTILPQISLSDLERFVKMGQKHRLGQVLRAFQGWLQS